MALLDHLAKDQPQAIPALNPGNSQFPSAKIERLEPPFKPATKLERDYEAEKQRIQTLLSKLKIPSINIGPVLTELNRKFVQVLQEMHLYAPNLNSAHSSDELMILTLNLFKEIQTDEVSRRNMFKEFIERIMLMLKETHYYEELEKEYRLQNAPPPAIPEVKEIIVPQTQINTIADNLTMILPICPETNAMFSTSVHQVYQGEQIVFDYLVDTFSGILELQPIVIIDLLEKAKAEGKTSLRTQFEELIRIIIVKMSLTGKDGFHMLLNLLQQNPGWTRGSKIRLELSRIAEEEKTAASQLSTTDLIGSKLPEAPTAVPAQKIDTHQPRSIVPVLEG